MSIKLIIVDDHSIVRSGMRALLDEETDMEVVGEAGDGDELMGLLEHSYADVVLMDINLKNSSGVQVTERIAKERPHVEVLGLTIQEDGATIEAMMDAGAKGYLFKNAGEEELQEGIRAVAQGERFFSHAASQRLIEHLRQKESKDSREQERSHLLTDRERHIIDLIAKEYTTDEIAEELRISPKTVDGHRRRLFQKLNVRNSAGLIREAIEKGHISSSSRASS